MQYWKFVFDNAMIKVDKENEKSKLLYYIINNLIIKVNKLDKDRTR